MSEPLSDSVPNSDASRALPAASKRITRGDFLREGGNLLTGVFAAAVSAAFLLPKSEKKVAAKPRRPLDQELF
ncbi:MAG: hypothetical protein KGO96_03580 [Elusimicrobia bacterium]|nr:hypothetical protein [Elusimicrobiota bacterium]MDE2237614.1 hypothetical protein [Elusimicrobiota bacterium]MDE2424973.1 hypothetical protein [Elusimicrobiota bacterium]